jgi:hypothetical protein
MDQSMFICEINEGFSIVPGETPGCPEPHDTIRVATDSTGQIMSQFIPCSEIHKRLSIISRDAASFCPKPHNAIRATIDSRDVPMYQSVFHGERLIKLCAVVSRDPAPCPEPYYAIVSTEDGIYAVVS